MREQGVRERAVPTCEMSDEQAGSLNKVCSDYRCSHSIAVNADQWPDDLRLNSIRSSKCRD